MVDTEAFREFKQALGHVREAELNRALVHIRRAVELERQNPFYLSYLGLLLARAEQKWSEAEDLCTAALRMKPDQPQFYLNLAEVYVIAGRREDAVETLTKGLQYARRDLRLKIALGKLATRRSPLLTFLPRYHFLNRHFGKLRHRVLCFLQAA